MNFLPHSNNALVAQLDRVSVSEAEGRGFDSRRARQIQTCGHAAYGHKFFCRYSRAHSVPNLCPSRAHYFVFWTEFAQPDILSIALRALRIWSAFTRILAPRNSR